MTNTFETNAQQCDVTTNSFHVEKPCNGSSTTIALSNEAPTQFEFGLEDIAGFQMLDGGELVISFVDGDETLMIENYAAMMQDGQFQEVALSDGETINLAKLAEGLSSSVQVADASADLANVEPAAGDELATVITKDNEYTLNTGETYQTDFSQADVADAQVNDNGDLVITFADDAQTTITNFKEIESADDIPTMTLADGTVIPVTDLLTQAVIVSDKEESGSDAGDVVAATQPVQTPTKPDQNNVEEEIALFRPEDLAAIEPAAGETAPAGALGNTGANFGSSVSDIGLNNVDAVGPIGVTALEFDRPTFEDDDFLAQISPVTNPPLLIANQAAGYEDNEINLSLFAQPSNSTDCLEILIENIPTGWTPVLTDATTAAGTFDPVAGTWVINLAPGQSLTTGPIFMPPKDSDGDITPLQVTVTQKDPVTLDVTATATTTFNVVVDAVADDIDLTANDVTAPEDTPAQLDLSTALRDVDGSEEITEILICNVPAGFMLSSGTEVTPGNFLVNQADLATLQLTPPANYSGTLNLEIKVTNEEVNFSDTEFDFTNNENVTTLPFNVTFTPVADQPTLTVADAQVKEDGNVDLPIKAELTDPSEALTICVENLDSTWGVAIGANNGVYDAATGVWKITLPAGQDYDGAINLTPPADSDLDMNDIVVAAISTESDGTTAQISETIDVVTDAVADAPTLTGSNVTGQSGSVYPLNLANALTDTDGSESLGVVTISGVPTGFTLTAGTEVSPGVWEIPQADVAGVGINTPAGYEGGFDLSVSVTTTETPTDTEYDFTDNEATTTIDLNVNLTLPELNAPVVEIAGEHQVLEDGSVVVPFAASLAANALPTDVLTVTLSGIDSSWTITTGANNGVYDAATGTWTITMPAGEDYTGAGLTFTPPADSDVDLTGLVLNATVNRPSSGASASTDANSSVIVDAVADMPTINAGADQAVQAGDPAALNISNALTDTDGSESLGVVTVSGVPAGYSLTAGTEVAPGVWEVAQADLAGLSLNTPANATAGDVTLTVSVTSTESVTDDDFNLNNNTATNTDTVVISISPDDKPVVENAYENVDETNLSNGVLVETGTVSANFGSDGPGTFEIDGRFTESGALDNGALTHNGVPVVVSPEGDTYVGRAGNIDVFTLKVNSNGSYEFNLIENLDHSEPGQTNENINLEFGFDAIDDDGDRTDGIISINVKDDVPTIVTKQTKTISEAGLADNASISYTGTLANSYGQDGPGDIKPTGYVEVKEVTNGPLVELKSVGEVVEITATANGYVGMAGTRKVFEVSIDNNGDYKYTQFESIDHPDTSAADEVIWLKFQVAITDFDGDQKTSFIQVDVVDTAPVAVSDSAPVLEGQMVTGNVTDNDTVGADAPGKITEVDGQTVGVNGLTVVGQYGTLVIQQDGSYKYTANNNNPDGVDSFSYTLKDADGDTDTAKLDITVTKILDRFPPEATFGSNGSGEGEVLEDGSVFVPITGSLNGDAPQVLTVEVSGVPSDWTIVTGANNGSYNATTGTWTITLPEGQDYDGGLTFTPPADSDIDLTGLTVTATSTLVSDNSTSSTDTDGKVIVDAVADTPDVEAGADKMVEAGQSVALDISNALTDTDGSESLGVVTISGVPEGASLSAGTEVSPGVWEVAQADLAGIELNVPESLISSENKLSASETLVGTGNSSATEDGITIEAINLDGSQSLELSYVDANGFEAGVGVNGSGTDKVFRDEAIRVSFDTPATSAAISVGDIGENNVNAGIDFKVYVVGQVDPIILEFQTPAVAPDGGVVTFNITPADVNGAEIESVVVFSDESVGSLPRSSFILTDVCAEVCVDNLEIPLTVSVTSTESVTDEDFDLTNNEATNTDQVIVTVTKPEVSSKPIVTNAKDTIDETNLVSGNIMETGAVSANFGEDGPGTFEIDNRFMSSGADNGNLTHNGDDVVVIKFGNVYSGLAGNVEVFTMTLNTDGSYEFVLKENLDHDNPSEDNETISLNFGFNAVDSDGDKSPGVISICVKDDVPSIDDKARRIDEDGLKTADVISYTHTLNHSYGEDDAGSIDPTGNFVAKFQVGGPDVTLSSNGVDIVVDPTADGYVGMAGADKVFDLVVNDNGQYTYRQFEGIDHQDATNPDDVIWLKFEVQITDFDGDSDTAMIIVDVHDSAPVAVDDTTQAGEGQTVTGNIVDNDVVGADDPGSLVEVGGRSIDANGETIVGQYGTLVIQQDGSYEYTANTNDPEGVDTFSYTMKDSDGDMDTAELKIAVNPDYEPPKVTFGSNASGSGRVYEDGSVMVPIVALLSGTASQVLTVEVSGISPDWTITTGANNGTYNATTGTWTIILPEGQDYDGGLTFTPPTDSDIDLTGLNVKATSQFVGTNTSLSSTTDGVVIVDAVADKPEIDAGENFTTGAGQSVKLDISNQLVDTDGSESLGDVTISGVPEGYSLSAGTQILPGVWVVSQDDLSGLKLNVPDDMLVHETCGLNAISDLNIDGEPSVTRNGITVEAVNPKNGNTLELTFYDETPGFEPGIGVQSNGHPTDKVFGDREGLRVSFETPMTSMAVVLGDIGENNLDSGIDFKVYVVGQEEPISLEYKTPSTAASDGTAMFEITSADLNGAQIESFVVFSDASVNSDLPRSSFTLVNVECGADVHSQQFELVASVTTTESVTDSDFDLTNNMASSTDSVVIKVQGSNVGSQGHDDVSGGADNDVLFGLQGDDILYGDAGNDVLNGGEDNNLLYGGDGLDTFVMDADKAGNNDKFDTVADFNLDEGDVLSLSEVISGFDSGSDINDFVRINLDGDTAVVQINSDGGQGGNFYNVAKINSTADLDATSLNVQDLFDKGHIDVY